MLDEPTTPIEAPESDTAVPETPEVLNEPDAVDPLQEPYMTNPFFYDVANYFGIEQKEYEATKDKLAVIVDWAYEEVGSKNPEDILKKIRELEDTLQSPDFGERRYANVYKYVRLASRKQSLEKAMSTYKKGGSNGNTIRENADKR